MLVVQELKALLQLRDEVVEEIAVVPLLTRDQITDLVEAIAKLPWALHLLLLLVVRVDKVVGLVAMAAQAEVQLGLMEFQMAVTELLVRQEQALEAVQM
jgi:hypothetical protein